MYKSAVFGWTIKVSALCPGPTATEPRLITSFTEFERVYGGLEPLSLDQSLARAGIWSRFRY